MTPNRFMKGNQSEKDLEELRGRLESQEESTNKLLDRAVGIKQSLADSIKNSKQVFETEKAARLNADSQIRMLVNVVGKLDRDIENVELSLNKNSDSLRCLGAQAHKLHSSYEIDLRNVLGKMEQIGGLQTKLETDIKILQSQGTSFAVFKENYERSFKDLQLQIHQKLCDLNSLMEKCERKCRENMSFLLGEIAERLKKFEFSCHEMYGEMKTYCEENFKLSDRQKENLDKKLTELIEGKFSVHEIKIDEIRKRCRCGQIEERLSVLERRVVDEQIKNRKYEEMLGVLKLSVKEIGRRVNDVSENAEREAEGVGRRMEKYMAEIEERMERAREETTGEIESIKKTLLRL